MQILNLLAGVQSFSIVLPEFQREYVWSKDDAKQLIISLFNEYPTGSLLFWDANGENIPELKRKNVDTQQLGTLQVILDGQQRITTLYMLMKGEIPPYYIEGDITNDPRNLYFNTMTGEFQYFMKTKMEGNPFWQKVTDCFDVSKVNAVTIFNEYKEKYADNPEEKIDAFDDNALLQKVNNNLVNLQRIQYYDYHIQTVPSKATIDQAIDVFDKVNSQGTKLTDAELVLTHITGKWPQARQNIKNKQHEFKENVDYDLNLDFFTRTIVVALTGSAHFKKNAKLDYNLYTKEDYIEAWKRVTRSLDYLIPILQTEGLISSSNDMATPFVLIPMVGYLLKNNIRFSESRKFGFLYWMHLAMIGGRYSGQTEARLDRDVFLATSSEKPIIELVNEIKDMRGRIEISANDLEGRIAGHPLYRTLYTVTKFNQAKDWANGSPIGNTMSDFYDIQSHHIFPQSMLYKSGYDWQNHLHKKLVNEIANRAFITRDTNYKFSDRSPEDYLPLVQEQYPKELKKQFIPENPELWKTENYERFLSERRKLIANGMNDYLDLLYQKYLGKDTEKESSWMDIINGGENDYVEFKQSLRWSEEGGDNLKLSEAIALKNIAAFLNSNGGKLFIGVSDDGEIKGIEEDCQTLNSKGMKQDNDSFRLHLDNLIRNYLGDIYHTYISIKIEAITGKDVCLVEVNPSDSPVILNNRDKSGNPVQEFYIRRSASTIALSPADMLDYNTHHFQN